MGWTDFTRRQCARRAMRHASDLTDREWGLISPCLPGARRLGRPLGTAFDVRYGNDDTEVAVTENAVQIEFEGGRTSSVRVKQGERAIYDYAKKETDVSPVDGLVALAWQRGQIAVDNAPLSYIVEEMNRHFYGRIVVAGSTLANRRVSGTIKVADTNDALAFVTKALGVKATRLGPLIVIRR